MSASIDPVEAYQNALTALQSHRQYVGQIRTQIRRFAQIDDWAGILIQGTTNPTHVWGSGTPTFNAAQWPTGEALTDAIQRLRTFTRQCEDSWNRVPESRRTGLTRPI